MEKKEAVKHLAIGAGIGLVVGAVVAVLVTPKKGKEVRKAITDKIGTVKEKIAQVKQRRVNEVHNK